VPPSGGTLLGSDTVSIGGSYTLGGGELQGGGGGPVGDCGPRAH